MARPSASLLDLARRGAEVRYRELQEEIAQLVRHFPDVAREGIRRGRRAVTAAVKELNAATTATPRRRKAMSAAQRKAVSARMKKYWAERRKAEK